MCVGHKRPVGSQIRIVDADHASQQVPASIYRTCNLSSRHSRHVLFQHVTLHLTYLQTSMARHSGALVAHSLHAHPCPHCHAHKTCKHRRIPPPHTQDWDVTKKQDYKISPPKFKLTFLWQEPSIAVAVDQVYPRVSGCGCACAGAVVCAYRVSW